MKNFSNKKWEKVDENDANIIKDYLLSNGGILDDRKTSEHELWRLKYSDATFTFYKKGTLFVTDSDDPHLVEVHNHINGILGSKFVMPTKDFLVGFDETGKGEVFGHIILASVMIPKDIFGDLEEVIGVADTKNKHTVEYWDNIFKKIDYFKSKGLIYLIEKIPPWDSDKYNINKILDVTYQRMLLQISGRLNSNTRIILDDYGIGVGLNRYLNYLNNIGVEVIKTTKADDRYLESRLASLVAKREQQKVLEAISKNSDFIIPGLPMGSGNAGDSKTVEWLKAWKKTDKPWPWFVKRSFSTVRQIDGFPYERVRKEAPMINEHLLSDDFKKRFESGELSVKSLSIKCPRCGTISKSIKIIFKDKDSGPEAICINCKNRMEDIFSVLRYYCGKMIFDSNIIHSGFISKDLESTRMLENFLFLLHPTVRRECDGKGGKAEIEKIGNFASIGRIRFEECSSMLNFDSLSNIERDESILIGAEEHNAIILTADKQVKGVAQAKGLFVVDL